MSGRSSLPSVDLRDWIRLTLVGLVSGICLGLAAPAVGAETESDEDSEAEEAEPAFSELVKRAQKQYDEGEYETAVRTLTRAYQKKQASRLLFNLGLAHKKNGDCAGGLVYFRSYLEKEDKEAKLERAAQKFMKEADGCEAYSEDLAGRLTLYSVPSGASVVVDGEERGRTPLQVVTLESGAHEVRMTHPERGDATFEVELESGSDRTVERELPPPEAAEGEGASGSGGMAGAFTPVKSTTWILGGSGLGMIFTGFLFDAAVLPQTKRKLEFSSDGSDAEARYRSRRNREQTVAAIGYIGGGALIASALVYQLVGPDASASGGETDGKAGLRGAEWRVSVGARQIGVSVRF